MKRSTRTLLLASTLALTLGGAALAMTTPAWAKGDNCHGGMGHGSADKAADRHTQLKAALQLTPAQESAWQRYQQSHPARGSHAGMSGHSGRADGAAGQALSTPARMEQMLAARKAHDAQLGEHLEALKAFYAALTPQQQATFDEHHRQGHRSMHGMRKHQH
jgi:periplasmic protein CpxP/Spy